MIDADNEGSDAAGQRRRTAAGGGLRAVQGFCCAVQFLTCLPAPSAWTPLEAWPLAAYFFAPVGLILGALLALANVALTALLLPPAPRLGIILLLNLLLTGGLHWDALADTADGFMARGDRERKLAAMRDSRLGSFGALALLFAVGLQWSALAALPPAAQAPALLLAPALSRAALVTAAALGRPARADGLGAGFMKNLRWPAALVSWTVAAGAALCIEPGRGLFLSAGVALLAVAAQRLFQRRFGGQTGDTLGAVNQLAETAVYLALLVQ